MAQVLYFASFIAPDVNSKIRWALVGHQCRCTFVELLIYDAVKQCATTSVKQLGFMKNLNIEKYN